MVEVEISTRICCFSNIIASVSSSSFNIRWWTFFLIMCKIGIYIIDSKFCLYKSNLLSLGPSVIKCSPINKFVAIGLYVYLEVGFTILVGKFCITRVTAKDRQR